MQDPAPTDPSAETPADDVPQPRIFDTALVRRVAEDAVVEAADQVARLVLQFMEIPSRIDLDHGAHYEARVVPPGETPILFRNGVALVHELDENAEVHIGAAHTPHEFGHPAVPDALAFLGEMLDPDQHLVD